MPYPRRKLPQRGSDDNQNFESQIYISYCGVASAVSVLNALGIETTQKSFFSAAKLPFTSKLKVMFGGMTLKESGQYFK